MADERDVEAVRQGEPLAPEIKGASPASEDAASGAVPDDLATRTGATVTGKDAGEA